MVPKCTSLGVPILSGREYYILLKTAFGDAIYHKT
jgi:hypothetical protein